MATVNIPSGMLIKPSSVQVATNENYVSALTATSGQFRQRDVSEKLVKRYGEQGITGLMELMGSKAPSSNTTFEHYEETFVHHSITAQFSSASANNAAEVTLTLQSSSYNEDFKAR